MCGHKASAIVVRPASPVGLADAMAPASARRFAVLNEIHLEECTSYGRGIDVTDAWCVVAWYKGRLHQGRRARGNGSAGQVIRLCPDNIRTRIAFEVGMRAGLIDLGMDAFQGAHHARHIARRYGCRLMVVAATGLARMGQQRRVVPEERHDQHHANQWQPRAYSGSMDFASQDARRHDRASGCSSPLDGL